MRFTLGDTTDTTGTDTGAGGGPSLLQQLITGFSTFKLGQQQLSTANQVTQLQLQRAAAGLPPLAIDPSTLGVPSVSVGLSSGTQSLLMYGLLGIGALVAFNMLSKRRK